MQIAHQFHGPLCGHGDSGFFQLQFNEPQICHGYDAVQEVASDLRVSKLPGRKQAGQIALSLDCGLLLPQDIKISV